MFRTYMSAHWVSSSLIEFFEMNDAWATVTRWNIARIIQCRSVPGNNLIAATKVCTHRAQSRCVHARPVRHCSLEQKLQRELNLARRTGIPGREPCVAYHTKG